MADPWEPWKLPVKQIRACKYTVGPEARNIRPRGSSDWMISFTCAGRGRYVTPRGTYISSPGDLVLYAPNDPQDYGCAPSCRKWAYAWIHFIPRPHWYPWLRWKPNEIGLKLIRLPGVSKSDPCIAALYRSLSWYWTPVSVSNELAMCALEEALLWLGATARAGLPDAADPRVFKAIAYMSMRIGDPIGLDDVARECGLSVWRLAHLFSLHTGTSPKKLLERMRMEHAANLLRGTDLPVSAVATRVGYSDPFYFSKRFRQYAKKSPTQVRRQVLKGTDAGNQTEPSPATVRING